VELRSHGLAGLAANLAAASSSAPAAASLLHGPPFDSCVTVDAIVDLAVLDAYVVPPSNTRGDVTTYVVAGVTSLCGDDSSRFLRFQYAVASSIACDGDVIALCDWPGVTDDEI